MSSTKKIIATLLVALTIIGSVTGIIFYKNNQSNDETIETTVEESTEAAAKVIDKTFSGNVAKAEAANPEGEQPTLDIMKSVEPAPNGYGPKDVALACEAEIKNEGYAANKYDVTIDPTVAFKLSAKSLGYNIDDLNIAKETKRSDYVKFLKRQWLPTMFVHRDGDIVTGDIMFTAQLFTQCVANRMIDDYGDIVTKETPEGVGAAFSNENVAAYLKEKGLTDTQNNRAKANHDLVLEVFKKDKLIAAKCGERLIALVNIDGAIVNKIVEDGEYRSITYAIPDGNGNAANGINPNDGKGGHITTISFNGRSVSVRDHCGNSEKPKPVKPEKPVKPANTTAKPEATTASNSKDPNGGPHGGLPGDKPYQGGPNKNNDKTETDKPVLKDYEPATEPAGDTIVDSGKTDSFKPSSSTQGAIKEHQRDPLPSISTKHPELSTHVVIAGPGNKDWADLGKLPTNPNVGGDQVNTTAPNNVTDGPGTPGWTPGGY